MERDFLHVNIDFDNYTDAENMLDYEIGYLRGLEAALNLTKNHKYFHTTINQFIQNKIKKSIGSQKQFLLEWLEDWEELDE